MRQLFFVLIIVYTGVYGQSPEQYLPNNSFEDGNCEPRCYGYYSSGSAADAWSFNSDIYGWELADPTPGGISAVASPDWESIHCELAHGSVCTGYSLPSTLRFINLNHDEGIRAGLGFGFAGNKTYKVRCKLRQGCTYDHQYIEMVMTRYADDWHSSNSDNTHKSAALYFPSYAQSCTWYATEALVYVPADDGGKMTNVVFWSPTAGESIHIDDVELYEYCTEWMTRQNREYRVFEEKEEAGHIWAGKEVAGAWPAGEVTCHPGSKTTYKGYIEVSLKNGFHAYRGAEFHAKIAPCGKECMPPDPSAYKDTTPCGLLSVVLGAAPQHGMTYGWVATPSEAIQYISSDRIANPVFTPPQGIGSFKYRVTITNPCGESVTKEIIVGYDNEPNSRPGFDVVSSDLTSQTPYFGLSLNAHTEKVIIQILDCSGNVVKEYPPYYNGLDFFNSGLVYSLTECLDPCGCYKFRIRSKNYCYDQWYEQVLNWNRSTAFNFVSMSNSLELGNSGPNGKFCVIAYGAKHIDLDIYNAWGGIVFSYHGDYKCNPMCFDLPQNISCWTYYVTMSLTDCGNNIHKYNNTLLVYGCGSGLTGSTDSSGFAGIDQGVIFGGDSLYSSIMPNPVTDVSTLTYHLPVDGHVKVSITNANFEQLVVLDERDKTKGDYKVSVNGNDYPIGTNYYLIEFTAADQVARQVRRISIVH